jgi:NADH-quinone oxidoreductase subunit A
MLEYIGIIFTFIFAFGLAALLLTIPRFLSPKFPSAIKSQPFECGKKPFSLPSGKISVHFYIVAMLFIVFDIELVFLFPWAVSLRELGVYGLGAMAVFLGFFELGFWYAWKKGAFKWE